MYGLKQTDVATMIMFLNTVLEVWDHVISGAYMNLSNLKDEGARNSTYSQCKQHNSNMADISKIPYIKIMTHD